MPSHPTVETGTLDRVANLHPPAADWSNNSHKITSVTPGTDPSDVATVSQLGGSQDWVFNVADYGATGRGIEVHDGAMGVGSANLACTTSHPFVSGMVGWVVMVKNAGSAASTTLVGVISTVTDSGHAVLSVTNASGQSLTGMQVQIGPDETPALIQATNDAVAYARAHAGLAVVKFPAAVSQFWMIDGDLITGGPTLGNSQIPLPIIPTTENKVTLIFEGPGNASACQHWQQTVMQKSGATLVSSGVYSSPSAQISDINANGNPSVIGGPTTVNGYGRATLFSNMYVVLKDISIRTAHSINGLTYGAYDFYGCGEASLQNFTYGTTGEVAAGDYDNQSLLASGLSIGGLMPANGNNDNCWTSNFTCQGGYTYAIFASEHFVGDSSRILYCWTAWGIVGTYDGSVGASHALNVGQTSVESCINTLQVFGSGQQGIGPWLYGTFDTEGTISLIDNTSGGGLNALLGEINLVGLVNTATINVAHPTGLKVVNGQQGFVANTHSSNYTVTILDNAIVVDASAGPVNITLISAAWTPNTYTIRKSDSSGNAVNVLPQGSEHINGATSLVLTTGSPVADLFPCRTGSSVWEWFTR